MVMRLRVWLIKKLAGRMPVILNVSFSKGTITLPRNKGGIVNECVFNSTDFIYID